VGAVSVKKRGKRKPLPATLPRIEVVHELPEYELTCDCGCRKQAIGEGTREQRGWNARFCLISPAELLRMRCQIGEG